MAERFPAQLSALLRAACGRRRPGGERAALAAAGERRELLELGRSRTTAADAACVVAEIGAVAERNPEHLAVVADDGALSYGALVDGASTLARHLHELGVGRDVCVGLCLPRGVDWVVCQLAVLMAGGAYVPIDPALPERRRQLLARQLSMPVVLTDSQRAGCFDSTPTLLVDEARSRPAGAGLLAGPAPDSLAYVIHTSGSTGEPKGVGCTHANLRALCSWYRAAFDIDQDATVSQFASLSFDATVMEVWPALSAAATLILAPDEVRLDSSAIVQWLERTGVTHAFLSTPVTRQLCPVAPPVMGRLRHWITGGAVLDVRPPPSAAYTLHNLYGPTEATVVASHGVVAPATTGSEGRPHIGRPVDHASVYILDPSLRPVPRGVAGELYIGGAGVATRLPASTGPDGRELCR